MFHNKWFQQLTFAMLPVALNVVFTASPVAAEPKEVHTFQMTVSAGAKACLPEASATVTIRPGGEVEIMDVYVSALPANTDFDSFVIQVPKAPFGVARYQGDIQTDKHGRG